LVRRLAFTEHLLGTATSPLQNGHLSALLRFFAIGRIGEFGLGYGDLEKIFYDSISGPQALILLIAKLAATSAVYAWDLAIEAMKWGRTTIPFEMTGSPSPLRAAL
jgi:hypothetical protein